MDFTCKYCGDPKTESQMAIRGGKISKQCLECKQSRASLGACAPKKKRAATRRPQVAKKDLRISLPAGGFGVDAHVTDEGHLQLTQENDSAAADNVCLTRREAKAIFERFADWADEA